MTPPGVLRAESRHGAPAPRPIRLADIAPRLARARDQHLAQLRIQAAELAELDRLERRHLREITHLQWVVEHRELQLLRAEGARRPQRYLRQRADKLQEIKSALERERRRGQQLADRRKATVA